MALRTRSIPSLVNARLVAPSEGVMPVTRNPRAGRAPGASDRLRPRRALSCPTRIVGGANTRRADRHGRYDGVAAGRVHWRSQQRRPQRRHAQ
jgi:hypothetical protein